MLPADRGGKAHGSAGIVSDSGADYIKTSTGFSTGGATADDVRLLRTCCPPHVKVKAAGGIASLADAEEFIRLGADRLGTSRVVKIAMAPGAGCTERCRAGRARYAGHDLLSRHKQGSGTPVCPLPARFERIFAL